ncbi:MAG: hypothetical protein QCH31_07745 [Methanolobus sp.]|nr:hypothetical protein [Methanolobus sp.]
MVIEHRNNVWLIRAGYCNQQEKVCIDRGFISFDLNLHIMDLFKNELLEMKQQPPDYKKYLHLKDKYRDFDRKFRKEFEEAIKDVDYSADRSEVVKKMKRLNNKLQRFDDEVKQFDTTMHKFDEFERMEQIKKTIITMINTLPTDLLDSWAADMVHFVYDIRVYDLIVLPIMSEGQVAIGRVRDPYKYREGKGVYSHSRRVDWHDTRVPFENMFFGFDKILGYGSCIIKLDGDDRDFVQGIVVDDTF